MEMERNLNRILSIIQPHYAAALRCQPDARAQDTEMKTKAFRAFHV
jgi:hypothetical protein